MGKGRRASFTEATTWQTRCGGLRAPALMPSGFFFICVPDHGVSSSVAVQVRCLPVVMVGAIFLEYGGLQGESQVFGSFRATSELMSVGLALKSRIVV